MNLPQSEEQEVGRYGIKTNLHHVTWPEVLEIWLAADEHPIFESAWNFDHLYPFRGDVKGPCLEAWVTLSALAQSTERIRLGTMVTGMHFRHPAVTASMASSLDIVAEGRFEMGLGAGWYDVETEAYGMELGSVDDRLTRFEEGTEVIHRLLTQETTDFEGKFFTLRQARNEPKPLQQPRPLFAIGGRGEKRTLRVVARYADTWDVLFAGDDLDEWKRLREVLWDHCQDVGRDPSEIACSSHLRVAPDPDPEEVGRQARRLFEAGLDVVLLSINASAHNARTVHELAEVLERDS